MNKKLTLLLCLQFFYVHGAAIVFDLGNVLINHNPKTVAFSIGLKDLIRYATEDKKNPFDLTSFVLEILSAFGNQTPSPDAPCATLRGHVIPQIICDFLAGSVQYQEILDRATHRIAELEKSQFFCSERERELALQAVKVLFDPALIAQYMELSLPGLKLVKKCLAQYTRNGKPAHQIYILSNWDAESFKIIRSLPHFKKLFNLFEEQNIVISADLGAIKPHRQAYQKFLARCGLKAKDCIFIDDQLENIIMAKKEGFTCIHMPDKNFAQVERRLKKLGVL